MFEIKKNIKLIGMVTIFVISLGFIQYFSWHYRIGFIESEVIKNKLIDTKYDTFREQFWQNGIKLDEKYKKQITDSQIIEYYVGVLFLLGKELHQNGDATLLYLQEIQGHERDIIKLLNKLKDTKYYYSAGLDVRNIDEWNSNIRKIAKINQKVTP